MIWGFPTGVSATLERVDDAVQVAPVFLADQLLELAVRQNVVFEGSAEEVHVRLAVLEAGGAQEVAEADDFQLLDLAQRTDGARRRGRRRLDADLGGPRKSVQVHLLGRQVPEVVGDGLVVEEHLAACGRGAVLVEVALHQELLLGFLVGGNKSAPVREDQLATGAAEARGHVVVVVDRAELG